MLCKVAQELSEPCHVVWEARVVEGYGPFDFWLLEWGLLVEVDGMQHTEGAHHDIDAQSQSASDSAKDGAALAKGYHVVRLHVLDELSWLPTVCTAMREARCGGTPRVHKTMSYPVLQPPMPTL